MVVENNNCPGQQGRLRLPGQDKTETTAFLGAQGPPRKAVDLGHSVLVNVYRHFNSNILPKNAKIEEENSLGPHLSRRAII